MISIHPLEYNSSFTGVTFNEFSGDEHSKTLESRYDIQATIDGGAYVEMLAVTEAGKEFEYEIRNVSKTDEDSLRDLFRNSIKLKLTASNQEYPLTGYIVKLTYGSGFILLKFAVDEVIT